MSSSLKRGALAATAVAFSLVALAGCGVGSNAQTLEVTPDNAATAVGVIKVQNAMIITPPKRNAKGPAVVSARLFNNGRTDQALQAVTLSDKGTNAQLSPAKGARRVVIPAGGSVLLGGKGNASAVLPGGREMVQDGSVQRVTFTFSRTGQVTLDAFVVPARGDFSKFGPSTVPAAPSRSPRPSPSASGTPGAPAGAPSGSPAGGPSGSPSGSPSANASGGAAGPAGGTAAGGAQAGEGAQAGGNAQAGGATATPGTSAGG